MNRRSRKEIRWASLRAAAKVALFASGIAACGAESSELLTAATPADAAVVQDAGAVAEDTGVVAEDASAQDVVRVDAAADAGLVADAGAMDQGMVDAGGCGTFPQGQEAFDAWQECCMNNFDDPGCQVWGPPAPPSMEVA